MENISIHLQNHSSVIVDAGGIRLLTDPWYLGTCFDGGWGLRYHNPSALDHVRSCGYLWISHFHGDHYHLPTLRKILEVHPEICVLANRSHNFKIDESMRKLGFRNVKIFHERTPIMLSDGVEVTRYPATGIDNMLLIRTKDATVLNFNDCVLPRYTKRQLAKRFGKIDIFMCNFNHAGKLLHHPVPSDEEIRSKLISSFQKTIEAFRPDWVIPYASHHYYRAKESAQQNSSLIGTEDLIGTCAGVIPLRVGETMVWSGDTRLVEKMAISDPVSLNELGLEIRTKTYPASELVVAAANFSKKLNGSHLGMVRLLPALRIQISDLNEVLEIHPSRGAKLVSPSSSPHIAAQSESIYRWMTRPYGSDAFIVGAHFDLKCSNRATWMLYVVAAMLMDNALDLRHLLKMFFTPSGLRFLWNRREEIIGILLSGQLASDYQRAIPKKSLISSETA